MGASSSSSSASHGLVAQGPSGGRLQSKDEYDTILQQEMDLRYIHYLDLSRWSPRKVRGHGHAKCNACLRKWTSYQASAIIDLKKQTIIKVWRQKCKECLNIVDMTFKKDEFRRAVNIMLDRLEDRINGVNISIRDDTSCGGPPHNKKLCEGCDWGSGDCRAAGDVPAAGGGGGGGGQLQRFGTGNNGNDVARSHGGSKNSTMSVGPRSAITRKEDTGLSTGEKIAIGGAVAVGAAVLIGGLAAWAYSSASEEEDKKGKKK